MTAFLMTLALLVAAGIAYTLYATARIQARWPRHGRLVMAGGVTAHVAEQGSGDIDVLVLHGAASNARELMAAFGDHLAGVRLIAPDRPGLGYSARPRDAHELGVQGAFVADILDQYGGKPIVCVGHSWGSAVLLRLALDRPDLVKALVLIAPASHPWQTKPNWLNRLAVIPVLGDLLIWTAPAALGPVMMEAGVARGFAPGPTKPTDYATIIGTPLFFRPHSYRANAEDMEAASGELALQASRYKDLKIPVSVISGQGDRIVYNGIHAAGLARDIPHATSYRVPGAGHMPHWVDPDLVATIIKAHVEGIAPPATDTQFRAAS
jgi:pimeloyl-ACP methyl ester carboxylesterase